MLMELVDYVFLFSAKTPWAVIYGKEVSLWLSIAS
jgi:hypothetical protein